MAEAAGDQRVFTVLLADDESNLRRLMSMSVEFDERLKVVAAAKNGSEALELADELRPDLAILDQMMGDGVTGLDVAGQLRVTHPGMRIILFSAADHSDDLLAGRVDALVTKTDLGDLGAIALRVLEA